MIFCFLTTSSVFVYIKKNHVFLIYTILNLYLLKTFKLFACFFIVFKLLLFKLPCLWSAYVRSLHPLLDFYTHCDVIIKNEKPNVTNLPNTILVSANIFQKARPLCAGNSYKWLVEAAQSKERGDLKGAVMAF